MKIEFVNGDLLKQDVEVIVNAWNRNIIPWWLLIPQGVSGAIKKRAGIKPFLELPFAPMPLGSAVITSAGRLPYKAIIHVAGINMLWRSSETAIKNCVLNAMKLAKEKGFTSVAFPILGSGSGGFPKEKAKAIMSATLNEINSDIRVVIADFGAD